MADLVHFSSGGINWHIDRSALDSYRKLITDVIPRLDKNTNPFDTVKESPRKKVYRLAGACWNRVLYLKIYLRDAGACLLHGSPAENEARAMRLASSCGAGTSFLAGYGFRRPSLLTVESFLLSISPADAVPVGKIWAEELIGRNTADSAGKIRDDMVRFLARLRNLHDGGVGHYDMNPGNVLFDPASNDYIFIDFHRWRRIRGKAVSCRARDIVKIYVFLKPWLGRSEWTELVGSYCGEDEGLKHAILDEWERAERTLINRRVRGITAACLRSRKGFERAEEDGVSIVFRKEYSRDHVLGVVRNVSCPDGWSVEREDFSSGLDSLRAGILGTGLRRKWISEITKMAGGREGPAPVALAEKKTGCRMIWSMLIRDGRGKAPYAVEGQFDISMYLRSE